MKAQEKTSRLEDALTNVRTSQQREQFLKQYTEDGYDRFADYLNEYMAEHDIDLAELLCRSNISRNYVYNIINGDRNPGREKIIALCIGAGMNCSEINRALKIAQEGILYAKDERDARIMIAVNQGNATVTEIAEDDLMQAFSSAIDEMEKSGAIRISQEQESIIKNMIKEELPRLTQDLNSLAMQYDASRGELTNDATSANDAVKTVLSRGTQMIMLLISAALCAALIALFWKNKSGFIWCAVVTGVVTACYVLLTVLGASGTLLAGGSPGDAFVLTLLSHGFKVAAIIGGVVTCIFVAAYIVWRARDRRKREYEENIETAKRFA